MMRKKKGLGSLAAPRSPGGEGAEAKERQETSAFAQDP